MAKKKKKDPEQGGGITPPPEEKPPESKQGASEWDLRVLAGAALLDQHNSGWYGKIDLDRFEMSDCNHCVIGQVFGMYTYENLAQIGVVEQDATEDQQIRYGFQPVDEEDARELNKAWITLIERRKVGRLLW